MEKSKQNDAQYWEEHDQYWRNGSQFWEGPRVSEARAEKIVAYLRRRYPDKTAESVAADGVASIRTVRNWLDDVCAPSLAGYSRMISLYGPDFLLATLDHSPRWLVKAAHDEERARLEARRAEVERQIAELRT